MRAPHEPTPPRARAVAPRETARRCRIRSRCRGGSAGGSRRGVRTDTLSSRKRSSRGSIRAGKTLPASVDEITFRCSAGRATPASRRARRAGDWPNSSAHRIARTVDACRTTVRADAERALQTRLCRAASSRHCPGGWRKGPQAFLRVSLAAANNAAALRGTPAGTRAVSPCVVGMGRTPRPPDPTAVAADERLAEPLSTGDSSLDVHVRAPERAGNPRRDTGTRERRSAMRERCYVPCGARRPITTGEDGRL